MDLSATLDDPETAPILVAATYLKTRQNEKALSSVAFLVKQ
jgi:hypothetical protein